MATCFTASGVQSDAQQPSFFSLDGKGGYRTLMWAARRQLWSHWKWRIRCAHIWRKCSTAGLVITLPLVMFSCYLFWSALCVYRPFFVIRAHHPSRCMIHSPVCSTAHTQTCTQLSLESDWSNVSATNRYVTANKPDSSLGLFSSESPVMISCLNTESVEHHTSLVSFATSFLIDME